MEDEDEDKMTYNKVITSGSTCGDWSQLRGFGWLHEKYERGRYTTASGFGKTM